MWHFFAISFSAEKANEMAYLHSHKYYELYFQLKGGRTYFCSNKYYALTENTLITTKPETLHKFENGPYERMLISVSEDMFSPSQIEFLNRLDEKVIISLSPSAMPQITAILNDLLALHSSVLEDKLMQISLKLGLLLHELYFAETDTIKPELALPEESTRFAISPTILKIMDYIKSNYNKKVTLDELCEFYSLSKTWICKCFWQANHMTIFEYKLTLQLNEAKKLLGSTKYTINKIAERTGFSSPNYFTAVFKKNEGITPLRFRRQFFRKK